MPNNTSKIYNYSKNVWVAIVCFATFYHVLRAEKISTLSGFGRNESAGLVTQNFIKTHTTSNQAFDYLVLEMSSQFHLENSRNNSTKLNLILGEQLSTNSQLGFGLGYRYFPQNEFRAAILSIDYRMLVGKRNLKPYFAMNLGTLIHYSAYKQRFVLSGIASSPSLGIQLKIDPEIIIHYGITLDVLLSELDYFPFVGILSGITF